MLYIGFPNYSKKIHAKIFCKKFKHCAPIIINGDNVIIYQFVHMNKIAKIIIQKSDLKILKKHGWIFIKLSLNTENIIKKKHYLTCVQFTKDTCGIRNIKIQTPLALFKYLNQK